MIFGNCLIETMTALGVGHINSGPRWRQKYATMITMRRPERVKRRLTCQVLKGSRGVGQPRSKNTYPGGRSPAVLRSAMASSKARRAKAASFTHGSAEPSPVNSCLTMRRPGFSTVARPRRPGSANSFDLPPLKHPEITTKRVAVHVSLFNMWMFSRSLRMGRVMRKFLVLLYILLIPATVHMAVAEPAPAGADAKLSGTYDVFQLDRPGVRVTGFLIRENNGNFSISGIGQSWTGQGRTDGRTGNYDWRFGDGRTGRTDFRVNSDGSLQGHAVGSGVDFLFVARRIQLPASNSAPEATAAPQNGGPENDVLAAIKANRQGNYAEAMRLFQNIDAEPDPSPSLASMDFFTAKRMGREVMHNYFAEHKFLSGRAAARERIGEYYEKGRSVPQDYRLAASWYGRAIDQSNGDAPSVRAKVRLAFLYANGLGVPRDRVKARELLVSLGPSDPICRRSARS